MNILFLTSWYPSRYDAMAGLCVRKHAQSVRRFVNCVEVIYLKPVKNISEYEITEDTIDGVHEIVVYYPNPKLHILKFWSYFKAFISGYKRLREKPDLVQVNILTRCGVLGYFLWKLKGIPYVIVEHWSRYHREGKCFKNWIHKKVTQVVVRNAKCVLPVSKHLAKAMQAQGLSSAFYSKINNVVDDFFYNDYTKDVRIKKRIIHISCFDERAKNVLGILKAIREVARQRNDFELILVGTGIDFDKVYQGYLAMSFPEGMVNFVGGQTPMEVCEWLKSSDFMVMFSNYENAPVVISEALAVGIPIISSNVGGIGEMMDERCGILIEAKDEVGLATAIDRMLNNRDDYDVNIIRNKGGKYSYNEVGEMATSVYKRLLQ